MEKAAYQTPEYRGCRVSGYYGKDGVGLIEVHEGSTLKLSSEVPAYKIWNYSAHSQELIDSVLGPDLPAPTEPAPADVILALRKRIHLAEKHNQWFERCESAWCNPSEDNDPAKGVVGFGIKSSSVIEPAPKEGEKKMSRPNLYVGGVKICSAEPAKVEAGDGLPPIPSKDRSMSWSDFWTEVAITARKELKASLLREQKLKELLHEVELMICDHVSCDVVMEGPRPYLRKKQELANELHQLGIKLAAVKGE